VLGDTRLALGEILSRTGDAAGAKREWEKGLQDVDSLARATGQTDILALQATALLDLGRVDDARPVVAELLRRDYRKPSFIALVRAGGAPLVQ
jgi:hypothetical protein